MNVKGSVLAIVSDKNEAKQALELLSGEENYLIIALWPDAESYIKQKFANWQNPLYALVGKNGLKTSKYIVPNFKKARKWANDSEYRYIRDRFAYFLVEFERSMDFATKVILKYKPRKMIVGQSKEFEGSSVIFGTLKTNAFYLVAKYKKIPFQILKNKSKGIPVKQRLGRILSEIRSGRPQEIKGPCDVLLIVTARQLGQMSNFIKNLDMSGLKVTYLTYNMTYEYRKKLEFISNYLEKEKLLGRDVKFESERLYRKLSKKKLWKKFVYKKFQRNQYVTEYLRDKIENMTFNDMRGVTFDIVLARKIIGELKPKVLLTLTDPDTKVLPYIDEAKKMGVKTVCLQHGAIYPFDAPAIYPESEYFIAWSKTSGNWLNRSTHFKSMKMLLGQSPFHQKPKIYTNKKQMRGLSILYLNTAQLVDHSIINYYLKRLFDELAISKRKIKLFLRMHPNQLQFSFNLNWLTGNSNLKIIWANNESLDELLKKVDIVIFENTTAGFDAMLLGKPTIYFNPYTGEDFFNVVRHKASLSILRNEEIGPKLLKFLENKKLYEEFSKNGKSYAQSYLGLSYNDSVNKITSSITEIVNV